MSRLTLRQIGSELARAFVVLALVFLSFAHAPAAAAAPGHTVLTAPLDMSWCGDTPDDTSHAPCHACRLGGGADLPPPADLPLLVLRAVADVRYGALLVLGLPAQPLGTATARGPPIA